MQYRAHFRLRSGQLREVTAGCKLVLFDERTGSVQGLSDLDEARSAYLEASRRSALIRGARPEDLYILSWESERWVVIDQDRHGKKGMVPMEGVEPTRL